VHKCAKYTKDICGYFVILVVDDYSLRLISEHTTLFDLMQYGVFHMEKLSKQRKRFPRSDAIYLVSPTLDSIQRIKADFKDGGRSAKEFTPQYGAVHLAFTTPISPEALR